MRKNTLRSRGLSRRDFLKSMSVGAGLALASQFPVFAQGATASKITYWHHFTSENEFKGLEQVMKLFADAHPEIQVTQENIPNADFMQKFTTAVLSNSRPDTAMVTSARLPDMVALDGLIPLTDRVNNWALKSSFPDNRWAGVTLNGEIWGVPAFSFPDWMYYRTDWFEEVGIAEPPKTMDEFLQAAIKLTDPDKGRYGFGMRGGGGGQEFVIMMLEAWGSPIVVDGKVAIDRDKAIDAITFYSELFTKYHVVPPSAASDSATQIREAFKTGQTGMFWHHTGSLKEMKEFLTPGDQFSTALVPAGPIGLVSYLSFQYNGMMKSDNADAAWDWISFWGETPSAVAFLDATGYFPASQAVVDDPRVSNDPIYAAAFASVNAGRQMPSFVGASAWGSNVVLPAFQKILTGEYTPAQAVDDMISGLAKLIE